MTAMTWRSIGAIVSCTAVYGLTHGFITPLLSLILEQRGADRSSIGLMAAVPAIGMLISSPFIPHLVTRVGLKPFLLLCLLGDVVLCIAFTLTNSYGGWLALRLLMGMTVSGLFIAAETWINEMAPDHVRGRLMAVYAALVTAAFAVGPLLVPILGTNGPIPFVACAAIIVIASLPLIWAQPGRALSGETSFNVWNFARVAPFLSAAVLLFGFGYIAQTALLPVYGVRTGLSESAAATMLTIFGAGGVLLQFPVGWLADKMDRRKLLLGCVAASGVLAFALPLAAQAGNVALGMLLFFWGGFFGGLYTLALTLVGQYFKGAELATANAAIGVCWGIGSLLGPLSVGAAMDLWDPHGLALVLGLACLVFVVLTLFFTQRQWRC